MIPKEIPEQNNMLFIHGGEYEEKILCQYSLFDLDNEMWVPVATNKFVPQLKAHAITHIHDPLKKEFYLILSGGFYREHLSNCEAETNKQKEKCICPTELVNDKFYSFRNNEFIQIQQKPLHKDDLSEKLKRFGHATLTASDGSFYMIGGFCQYIGYLIDIIQFKPKLDIKNKTFYFESQFVDVGKNIPGRVYPTCQIIHDNIIVYGGLKDDRSLNDLWVINLKNLSSKVITMIPSSSHF